MDVGQFKHQIGHTCRKQGSLYSPTLAFHR
jgi:hypothetical protein